MGWNLIAQGTNVLYEKIQTIRVPETVQFFKNDNKFLSAARERPLLPFFQTNRNMQVFRVIVVTGNLVEDKPRISHMARVAHNCITLKVVYDANHFVCSWKVDATRFPPGNLVPCVIYSKTGTWNKSMSKEWFRLLWRCEIFSLPSEPSRNWDDGSLHLWPFQEVSNMIYIEKSTSSEYVLIERLLNEHYAAIDKLLEQLCKWFPDVEFPK